MKPAVGKQYLIEVKFDVIWASFNYIISL
jgi:hypothetical protein